jgi:SulP family sulfate permease
VAYAALAGLPASQGLHSNAVAPFACAATASSRYLQTGCVAMTSLLTAGALAAAGLAPGSPGLVAAASLLALMVGATRVALAALNAGALLARLPPTVLQGFAMGVAALVIATQTPVILGAPPPPGMHFLTSAAWLALRPALWSIGTMATGAATAACLIFGRKVHPLFPGAVLACVAGCAAAAAGLPVGPVVGSVQAGLPHLVNFGALPWHLAPVLAPAALAIAAAGFAEPAAVGSRFALEDARLEGTSASNAWSANRELLSQGLANLGVALFGGFPVGGSLSRSSLARAAGGRSQRAHVVTGLCVLAFLPAGAAALSLLPRAALGALTAVALAPLLKPPPALTPRLQFSASGGKLARARSARAAGAAALGWVTAAATLAAAPRLELGLGAGLALAGVLAALRAASRLRRRRV